MTMSLLCKGLGMSPQTASPPGNVLSHNPSTNILYQVKRIW
jgi:hypothetical protein